MGCPHPPGGAAGVTKSSDKFSFDELRRANQQQPPPKREADLVPYNYYQSHPEHRPGPLTRRNSGALRMADGDGPRVVATFGSYAEMLEAIRARVPSSGLQSASRGLFYAAWCQPPSEVANFMIHRRQLGSVGRNPPRLILGEQLGR